LSAQAKDEAAGLVRDLVIGYWELAYATETLAVDREGEALAAHQLLIAQDVVRVGMQPPSAVKIAELQVALRRETILRDEMTLADQSLTVRRLVGLELVKAALVPSDAPELPRTEWTEDTAVAATLAHGPTLVQSKLALRQADIAVDVASNARLPRLDLKLTGELDGVGSSTGGAFDQLGSAQAYSVMGGLTFSWELGGAASAATDAARAHRTRLDAERASVEDQLSAQAMSAVRQLRLAKQRIDLSEIAIQVAEEALRSESVAFQAGHSTTVLVFQRQDDVAQAKLRRARARIDAVEAATSLDYLTGGLLARYGVTVTSAWRQS
jgi:HAE1 family hydrophobic/amphiphilic exporter-1